jgi:hypothetical protein
MSVWGRPLVACALEEGRLLTCLCSSTPVRKANDLCRQNPLASLHVTRGPRFLFHPAFLFNQFSPNLLNWSLLVSASLLHAVALQCWTRCSSGQPDAPLRHTTASLRCQRKIIPIVPTRSTKKYRSVQSVQPNDIVGLHTGYWRCGTTFCLTFSTIAWASPAM